MSAPKTESAALPDASIIAELAKLGRDASGIDIITIATPPGIGGLPESVPVAVSHEQYPKLIDVSHFLEAYRTRPERKAGIARALTLASFIDLVNRHKTADSVIFADTTWTKPSFTAVIDYHQNASAGDPAFGKHRIGYAFPLSEEWQAWVATNGKAMSQRDFAAFLEDRIADLSSPTDFERNNLERDFGTTLATPAELIRLSRGLQVNVDAKVKRAVNLQTGESEISFEETHKDADGKPIKVPGLFVLSIAPFFMGDKVRVPVRLRYRVAGENIAWFYQIYRPDQSVTERVRTDLGLAEAGTALPAFEGTPEMSA